MEATPKVSVIMPSLNVGKYIRECIESVINQTLKEIQIICVDAGSTDGTLEILQEYAAKDKRISIINSDKKSYGYQMNLGLDVAVGEYIGIVETDDFIKEDMYEKLYEIASNNCLDMIKADFYRFVHSTDGKELELTYYQLSPELDVYGKVVNPQEHVELFNLIMNTWSGIYSRKFLNINNIRHNETPGASYQDNGFWFKTFALATRAYFVHRPFYMNRRDNPNSSVHSKSKVYCMNEEYTFILSFLNEQPALKERLMPMYCYKKYQNYMFTYNRIANEFKLGYIVRFSEEFKDDYVAGYLDKNIFGDRSWNNIMSIISDPLKYYLSTSDYLPAHIVSKERLLYLENKVQLLQHEIDDIHKSVTYRTGRFITFIPRKLRQVIRCFQAHGLQYTISMIIKTIRKGI